MEKIEYTLGLQLLELREKFQFTFDELKEIFSSILVCYNTDCYQSYEYHEVLNIFNYISVGANVNTISELQGGSLSENQEYYEIYWKEQVNHYVECYVNKEYYSRANIAYYEFYTDSFNTQLSDLTHAYEVGNDNLAIRNGLIRTDKYIKHDGELCNIMLCPSKAYVVALNMDNGHSYLVVAK